RRKPDRIRFSPVTPFGRIAPIDADLPFVQASSNSCSARDRWPRPSRNSARVRPVGRRGVWSPGILIPPKRSEYLRVKEYQRMFGDSDLLRIGFALSAARSRSISAIARF